MGERLEICRAKLVRGRIADPDHLVCIGPDATLASADAAGLAQAGRSILNRLGRTSLVATRFALPFADFLIRRASADCDALSPRDAESSAFLRDLPIVRRAEFDSDPVDAVACRLKERKAVLVEGVGVFASGAKTIEEACSNVASAFHAVVVKYLLDLLADGVRLPEEPAALDQFRNCWLTPIACHDIPSASGPLEEPEAIRAEMIRTGNYAVEQGLAGPVFGAISCRSGNRIYISESGAGLDALAGCIATIPDDTPCPAAPGSSIDLPAHHLIYRATGARTILHGSPRFAVAMSMLCDIAGCPTTECWRDCPKVRWLGAAPLVSGDVGGLASRLASVIGETGRALVYGRGVFTIGRSDFAEALRALMAVEASCRRAYFRRLDARLGPGTPEGA